MNDIRNFIITAKRSKKDKGGDSAKRSRLLKVVMPALSGDQGKALADAIEKKDIDGFKSLWSKATSGIVAKLEEDFKSAKG